MNGRFHNVPYVYCAVLVANDDQCSIVAADRKIHSCYDSHFTGVWYDDSVDDICQYVCVFIPVP